MARRQSKFGQAMGIIFVVILLVVAVGGVVYLSKNGGVDLTPKTFTVSYEGEVIDSEKSGLDLGDSPLNFAVTTALTQDYTLQIVPAPEVDFDFIKDGSAYLFAMEPDLTPGFNIEYTDTGFSVRPSGGIVGVLSVIYGGADISCSELPEGDLFQLQISSGSKMVKINFRSVVNVTGVTLTDEEILIYG